jgi:hypothetical protein
LPACSKSLPNGSYTKFVSRRCGYVQRSKRFERVESERGEAGCRLGIVAVLRMPISPWRSFFCEPFVGPYRPASWEHQGSSAASKGVIMMTPPDFQRLEMLLRICATNVARCQEVVRRSSALVKRAKKLLDVCQETLSDRESAGLKSIGSAQRAVAASERLLVASNRRMPDVKRLS